MYYIGIDLGGTNIAAGIVDENLKIVKKDKTPTLASRAPEEIVADMGMLCNRLVKNAGLTINDIAYVGIASPGAINPETGYIVTSNNIPFVNYPMTETLRKYFPCEKIYIENDANAAALGEALAGAAKGANISVMITLGTGVGGGIIIDGKVYSGFNHYGAELGHIVIDYKGRPCTCGRCGCWEAYSSATALKRITREKLLVSPDTMMWDMIGNDINNVNDMVAFAAMKKGDKPAQEVVDEYISYLACGVTNIVNIFQPDIITIGGGICNEGDWLLVPLREKVNGEQYTRSNEKKTEIKVASLGNDAGIIGAAVLGLQ